ncbi:MAG: hypothetical protein HC903_17860 [Methylacidiphilales bacterium]|nr:hypothetical protein [Candidatus Methylacidiphilales bacterium]NJR17486.1 hypothetical protein [Calothrix sp. CSU_2_0]
MSKFDILNLTCIQIMMNVEINCDRIVCSQREFDSLVDIAATRQKSSF